LTGRLVFSRKIWYTIPVAILKHCGPLFKKEKPVSMTSENKTSTYTCREYREEMILLALQKKLSAPDLTPEEKEQLLTEIARVSASMGMD
jgi:hypothetical protein